MSVISFNADLHCHSYLSDGVLAPAQLAQRAAANGVTLWSLTDHDEVTGLAEASTAARQLGMQFIPGVEISTSWANQTVHILGLNIDPHHPALVAGLSKIRAGRVGRGKKIAERLEQLGVSGAYEGALKFATNPQMLSRTHFARYLIETGRCRTMQEVFNTYLGDTRKANVRVHWCTLEESVGWIRSAGGRAVIAHPGRYLYTPLQADALFEQFKDLGGAGLEVYTGSHTRDQFRQYSDVVRRYGFMASSGSDFHAPSESKTDLGSLPALPADVTPVWHDWL